MVGTPYEWSKLKDTNETRYNVPAEVIPQSFIEAAKANTIYLSDKKKNKDTSELYRTAYEVIKKLVMGMDGLSEDGFINKQSNDPCFHAGVNVLIDLFVQAKFNVT
jgi:hypothetical protein